MKDRIAILMGLVAAIVLLFTSASTVSAASDTRDRNRQLSNKETLTADDVGYIKSLQREERRGILVARGWQEIAIPDQYEDYQDLVSVNEVAKNEALIKSGQMRSLDETLKAIQQRCMYKEDYIPFDQFKAEERWVPSPKDLQRNRGVLGGWGTSPGDRNSCDFGQSANGDAILVKGSGLFPGVFCHAALVVYSGYYYAFAVGPDGDSGVWWNTRDQLHQYSHASVQRVDTWPLSSNRRQNAADYAYKQLGKPYNWIFIDKWRTDAFYCSQLCWAAYYRPSPWYYKLDIDGVPDGLDFGAVAPDALWASWRTDTVTCSD